jgi:hypothetical protein
MRFGYAVAVVLLGLTACTKPAVPARSGIPLNDSLVNGDFTLPIDKGWATIADDLAGSHRTGNVPDSGATVTKDMCGTCALIQDVKLRSTDLEFSTWARFHAETSKPDYYAAASIRLGFLDANGTSLGETRIHYVAGNAPLANSSTLHLIPVSRQDTWQQFSVDLGRELAENLKDVDPTRVKRLRVSLESFGSGDQAC